MGVLCSDCVKQESRANPRAVSRPGAGRPVLTIGIIVVCLVLWIGQQLSSAVTDELFFAPAAAAHEPWRFLTAAFVHDPHQVMHIAFNMFALYVMGQYLEPILGRARFAALYLISALGGSVVYELFAAFPAMGEYAWWQGTVGASGAIFGLFLAVVVINLRLKRDISQMIILLALNAALSIFVAGIAWQAHLGGALTGAACAAVLSGTRERRLQWAGLGVITVLLVVLGGVLLNVGPTL